MKQNIGMYPCLKLLKKGELSVMIFNKMPLPDNNFRLND